MSKIIPRSLMFIVHCFFFCFGTVIRLTYFAMGMKLVLVENIIYEILVETPDGKAKSEFFTSGSVIKSRERALNRFLELTHAVEFNPDVIFVTLYGRYLPTGDRIELVNTVTYESPGETLAALAQEVYWYQGENIATNLAIYDPTKPDIIKILWPLHRTVRLQNSNSISILIASHYWVFLGPGKKEILRFGSVF